MNVQSERLQALAGALVPRLVEMRRELHRHPELSGAEYETTSRLRRWLTEAGLSILPLKLQTGLVAEVQGVHPGPVVAIRADIDALPIQEETGLPYASTVAGRMHACGHDLHTATALGAALVLQQMRGSLRGRVRFLFQPAEEIAAGALPMIEAGALDGVRAIFGLHNKPDLPSGSIGLKNGPLMAAVDRLQIRVTGRGGHAAIPDAAIDPIVAGSAIVMALQTAVSRSISPLDAAVVTVGSFQAGTAHNIIPPVAEMTGTIRTFRTEVRDQMPALLKRIAGDVASGYGATAEVRVIPETPAVANDPAMVDLVRASAGSLGLPVTEAMPTMAAEDFAQYQRRVPGCFFWLGTGCAENWHHPRFLVDEAVMEQGAALFAQVAIDALSRFGAADG